MRYLVAVIVCLFYYSINVFAIDVDLNEFIVNGCTDIAACNYDPLADTDDGTCSYDDADGDGVCDDDEILGCTFAVACNYNSAATDDDGSCDYTSCYVFGCLNTFACNYNPLADYDDGTCDFTTCAGCTDVLACDYDPTATISEHLCQTLALVMAVWILKQTTTIPLLLLTMEIVFITGVLFQ